jgi:hypothetical protein
VLTSHLGVVENGLDRRAVTEPLVFELAGNLLAYGQYRSH